MKTVYDALDPIVNGPATTKEKGDKYEAACVHHLKKRPFLCAVLLSRGDDSPGARTGWSGRCPACATIMASSSRLTTMRCAMSSLAWKYSKG